MTKKEVSAHSVKSTKVVKPPAQQEIPSEHHQKTESSPAQPTLEADAVTLQQTTASPKYPEVTFQHSEPVQAQQPTLSEVKSSTFGPGAHGNSTTYCGG